MQGVELVLVLRLPRTDALGTFQQRVYTAQCRGESSARDGGTCRRQFAFDLAQHDTEKGALAFNHASKTLELLGVGVAAGLAPEFLTFPGEGLLERDPRQRGGLGNLGPCDLQQPAVHRMGDHLLLRRVVDDDPLEFIGAHRHGRHRRSAPGLEQFLHADFANRAAKTPDLRSIARPSWLVTPDH